jgi:hypothetical protein
MSRIKCSKCGKAAHTVIEGKAYCMGCIPKPTMPVIIEETFVNEVLIEKVERPRPWPNPPTNRVLVEGEQLVQKKPWWKKIIAFFDDRRPK